MIPPKRSILALVVSCGPLVAQPPHASDLHAWLTTDVGVTVVDDKVTQWADQSGNGFSFAPPGTGPGFVPATLNGLAAVRFDGSTQLNGSLGTTPLTGASVFALFRSTVASANNDYLYTLGTNGGSGSQMTLSRNSGDRAYHYDGSIQNNSANGALTANQWFVSSQIFGGRGPSSHDLFLNGSSVLRTNASNPYSANVTICVLGNWTSSSFRTVGDLVEFVVYDRTLSEPERSEVEEYLRLRAGLPPFFKSEAEILSDWEVVQYEFGTQSDASWTFDLGGTRADQAVNSDASILLSDIDVAGKVIWGEIGSGSAPDFMGFVFGFRNTREFYLFDWKKTTASYSTFGTAERGMRLTTFHLAEDDPTGRDFWASDIAANTTVLRTNDIPWAAGKDYDFSLRFTPGSFVIRVWDGETVIETWEVADSTYAGGRFGYFVNSLQGVRFGQVLVNEIGPLAIDQFDYAEGQFSLRWLGGEPPYVIERGDSLSGWMDVSGHVWNRVHSAVSANPRDFFRVRSIGQQLTDGP